ncbi:MAG: hypothetical protein ABJF07_04790, partial [Nisaea sp.]|uniref:hypothetical protein n=1 Tax=Nisaea sp. TaxID=2024842 RepID=UPI00326384AB
ALVAAAVLSLFAQAHAAPTLRRRLCLAALDCDRAGTAPAIRMVAASPSFDLFGRWAEEAT